MDSGICRTAGRCCYAAKNGGACGMTDYIGAAVLFIFIVAVLIVLWRREHR